MMWPRIAKAASGSPCVMKVRRGAYVTEVSERDLADGVGRAARLAEAGSPLCLGSDSLAVIDLFEEARAVELDQRLVRFDLDRPTNRPVSLHWSTQEVESAEGRL